MPFGRRTLLLSTVALVAPGCAPAAPRPVPTAVPLPADFDRWNQEALGILSDVQLSLRAFDAFQAFRASVAPQSTLRLGSELVWDPPTGAAWDEATHVARGLHGRADQLFQTVSAAKIDPNAWRDQRALADASRNLIDLGDALGAYRNRIDALPPGDGSNALSLLDTAWAQWEASAAHWNIGRSESIGCTGRA